MEQFGDEVREVRWKWFGHVVRSDIRKIQQRMLGMELDQERGEKEEEEINV